jgi:predicted metal-dependent peptidase
MGFIAHEVSHLAFLHLLRVNDRNKIKWNIATDLVINGNLKNNNFDLPDGLIPDDEDNFTLKKEIFGKEIKIENILEKTSEEIYDELKNIDIPDDNLIESKIGRIDEHRTGNNNSNDIIEQEKWKQILEKAVMIAKLKGDLPFGLERYINDIRKSKINWKILLKRYINESIPTDYTYMKRGKKSYATKCYLPDTVKDNIDIDILIDVSGSIGTDELTDFISEIIGIIKKNSGNINIKLYTHQTDVDSELDFKNANIEKIKKIKIIGGGGTSFNNVIKKLNEKQIKRKTKILLWLTDGYGDIITEKRKYPIIWVLTKNGTDSIIKKSNKMNNDKIIRINQNERL